MSIWQKIPMYMANTGVGFAQGGKLRRTMEDVNMPKGPQGQQRPPDVIGNAVHIARIATGEVEDTSLKQPAKRKGGLAGAKARQQNTTPKERSEIAKLAAEKRWKQ